MSKARLCLIILIYASPIILLFDGSIMHGILAGVAALGMAIVSRTMRPVETEFFLSFARLTATLSIIPALWMLIQALPISALAHPIWVSAEVGLGYPIWGAISIDIGTTVMVLGQYLTIVAIAFWAAAVAVDRQRAEWILFSLMTATALIGLTIGVIKLLGMPFQTDGSAQLQETEAIDCAAIGVIIAIAAAIRTLERYETRRAHPGRSISPLLRTFVACAIALIICSAVLILSASSEILVATAYGALALVSVFIIRRFGLDYAGILAIALPAIGVAGYLALNGPGLRTADVTLNFATDAPASVIALTQRILDDAPWKGTGAGTIAAIAPIYSTVDDQIELSSAPTAAAAIAIELGRPMLWLIVGTIAGSILLLLRASLRRGRDSFYPAAGAGCLITLLFLSYMNAGMLGSAPAMIAGTTLALAIAQGKGRTVHK